MRIKLPGCTIFIGYLLAAPSWSAQWDLAVGYTAEYTTNTALSSDNEIEEWTHKPGFTVNADHEGPNLELNGGYDFERRLYEEDVFDDENATTGSAELLWHMVPERLDFVVRNSRTESPLRAINAVTPDNLQVVSTTEAGPTLRFRSPRGNEFQLAYLYTDVDYNETQTDSERQMGTARYIVALSRTRSLSFDVSNDRVDFDSLFAPDLDIWTGSVTISNTGSNSQFSFTGGYSTVGRTMNREDIDGSIFDLDISWQAGINTVVAISGSRQFRDRSTELGTGRSDFGESVEVNTDLNEVFTETLAEVSLTQTIGRSQIGIRASASEEDYEDVPRDNTRTGIGVTFARDLTPLTRLRAGVEIATRDFDDENEKFDQLTGNIQLVWRAGRRLTVSVGAVYQERDSDRISGDYDEWAGSIGVSYVILGTP
ncbi:MAG: hypothetical protein O7E57_16900 [Gammaproteobacteria bacterium]|nr:hypothetical protein [Gammaproteobacteria bacterium]